MRLGVGYTLLLDTAWTLIMCRYRCQISAERLIHSVDVIQLPTAQLTGRRQPAAGQRP